MHRPTIKITPNLLFEYQCTSGKFIRLPNRIESKLFFAGIGMLYSACRRAASSRREHCHQRRGFTEHDAPSALHDVKLTDQVAGRENARHEIAGQKNAENAVFGGYF